MPLMNDLLEKLQDAPPGTEQELRDILQDTGYDLVMVEPSMGEEMPMEASEEVVEEEEYPEDMGPVDSDEDGEVEVDIIEEITPGGDPMSMMQPGMMPPGATPRMVMHLKTKQAAKKALKEG